ncbi:class I SAM-dependent methyltransferase [Sphingomonas oligophenolica]|uniref:Methyltransferase domain-containing protein n=1 Tax=Sphingomonas oligophenolica TaxID=301154 RepID=A0A502CIC6_9SPHN|nr:methyltransferase domain-containing protein [Sphingomonas oligophenolica]TPG12354.1 methyltransferase domain-containing protein [Sphingomonas oligophenolica]
MNYWTAASGIVDAFGGGGGGIAEEMIVRTLSPQLPCGAKVVDLGGGDAALALRLAAMGHRVVAVDIDPRMIAIGRARLAAAPAAIAARVAIVEGDAATGRLAAPGDADLVCCHSVLMYEDDPAPLIGTAVALARRGGLVSIAAVSPAAIAMRPGLAGRWREARIALETGDQRHARYAASRNHPRAAVAALLAAAGAPVASWSGIGIFTDHHDRPIDTDEPDELL